MNARPQSTPLVTVITATYNCSAALALALESVRMQEFTDFEAWVVGDNCTDDSEDVVRSIGDPRFRWRNLDRNSGSQAAANNEGLRLAAGRYVAYLGHDDLWFPSHLSTLVECIQRTGADLVHSLCALVTPEGAIECFGPPREGVADEDHFFPPSSWLYRRELGDECGYWVNPDELADPVDFEYLRRISRSGHSISFCPRLTVLKFPSACWQPYASPGRAPQRSYLEALKQDSVAAERAVLLSLSIAFARERYGGDPSLPRAFRKAFGVLRRSILRWGQDRWPFSGLIRRRYQKERRNSRSRRGLPKRSSG